MSLTHSRRPVKRAEQGRFGGSPILAGAAVRQVPYPESGVSAVTNDPGQRRNPSLRGRLGSGYPEWEQNGQRAGNGEDVSRFVAEIDARLSMFTAILESLSEELVRAEERVNGRLGPAHAVRRLPIAEPATVPVALPPEPAGAHFLFVPSPAGYLLIVRPGLPPAPGSDVTLADVAAGEFVVSKLGPAPLPGDGRRCAYLQQH